ncbi:MAG: C15orf41 family protein [Archaeoglobaceae archaeon]|nr:C15orf41 family protein [Archaeoglobaceae archaeon]MCX8152345.1 C15orf41 family protein [Archaeoglobaceae archaeon]MDW8013627.1 TPD domain-containing protein [Archaeoglobaceae archaeon]
MKIGVDEYKAIRKNLSNIKDLDKFNYPRGILHSILLQKKVDYTRKNYHRFASRIDEVVKIWKSEKKFPEWLKLTPAMKLRLLLKGLGYRGVDFEDLGKFDEDLRRYAWKALTEDYVYSPIATKIQAAKGEIGEKLLLNFVDELGVDYKTEKELKGKTPDVLFVEPVKIFGKEVRWIESKAFFADQRIHEFYETRQYSHYRKIFGEGLVVYWFGSTDQLDVLTYSDFDLKDRNFLEMKLKVRKKEKGDPIDQVKKAVESFRKGKKSISCSKRAAKILKNMGFLIF